MEKPPHTWVEPRVGQPAPTAPCSETTSPRILQATLPSASALGPTPPWQGARPAAPSGHRPPRLPPPCMLTLRGEVLEHSPPQRIRVRFPVDDSQLNPYGVLQGGFLAAMIDNVIGMCAYAADPRRQSATLELSVRYFRSIRAGHVIIDGAPLRSGRTTITIECLAWDDAGELCAKATATNMFVG